MALYLAGTKENFSILSSNNPISNPNFLMLLPEGLNPLDAPYMVISGEPGNYTVTVDELFKAEKIGEQNIKKQIEELYNEMVKDVFERMFAVFQTNNSDSAIATRETWKDMILAPADYASEGLKSPEILRDSSDNIIFGVGDDLNTEQKVLDYANRKLTQARDYGIWRIKRIDTFRDQRNQLLGV